MITFAVVVNEISLQEGERLDYLPKYEELYEQDGVTILLRNILVI